jgi:hypothetical protein
MSNHAIPMGLTRGYSNSYSDTLRRFTGVNHPVPTQADLDLLDELDPGSQRSDVIPGQLVLSIEITGG